MVQLSPYQLLQWKQLECIIIAHIFSTRTCEKILFTLLSIHFLIFFIQIPWNVSTVIVFGICFYSSSTKFCTMEIVNMINTATTSMKKKVNTSYYMQMNIFLLQNLWILKCSRTLSWRAKEIPLSLKDRKMPHIICDIMEINWLL